MAKIDNDKMWASIMEMCLQDRREGKEPQHINIYIQNALTKQGLKYNPDTKSIEEIKEKSGWYKCINYGANTIHAAVTSFVVGHLYYYEEDYGIKVNGGTLGMTKDVLLRYFRPATEEEIAAANSFQSVWPEGYAEKCAKEWAENPPKGYNEELRKFCKAYLKATDGLANESKFKIGDHIIYLNEEYSITDVTDHYILLSTRYLTTLHLDFDREELMELVEPEELHDKPGSNRLNEFEGALASYLFPDARWRDEDVMKIKKKAKALLNLARKQIASEINAESMTHKEWLRRKDEPLFWPANTERAFYKQGIEDCVKAIEKGDKV